MTNFSNALSHSGTNSSDYDPEQDVKTHLIIFSFVFVTCIFGLVGNGTVIWLLGFRMKRNPFTIYILNLAVADFGVLLFTVLICLIWFSLPIPYTVFSTAQCLFIFMFCTSQFLLTVISIDRCVSVFFPVWHRCHRPSHLSTTVCALIWVLNFLFCGTEIISGILTYILGTWEPRYYFLLCQFFANAVLCFPLITISTLTLFFKVCCKPKQHKRGKLLTVILLTLLVFLILAFPFNVVVLCNIFFYPPDDLIPYGFLCASLNSAINPLIYFLVGKKKRGQVRENIKAILQKLFKEEEEFLEEPVHGEEGSEAVVFSDQFPA